MTLEHAHHPRGGQTRRLAERAHSIAEVERALARIWATLTRDGMSEREADGRLMALARTRVLTLVVVASRPETAERAIDAVIKLAARHPSRALVLAFGDPTGPPAVDARVQAHCHPFGGSSEVCTEQVFLRIDGDACQHPAAVAAPLVLHDLPVALWWTDDPPVDSRPFGELAGLCDRLVVDSGLFRDDGRARLIGLAAQAAGGREIHDIGWMRLALWRELLAGLFDDPALTPFLRGIGRVRLTVAQLGSVVRVSRATLYAGWLASRLGWRVEESLEPGAGDAFRGAMSRRGQRVELEVAAEPVARDPRLRAPGSLLRVEVEAVRSRRRASVSVTRRDDHLLAEAAINGGRHAQRAATLERFEDSPYLAQALEASASDPLLDAALPIAARLAGAPGG